jgi:hypothetical protein
MSEHRWIDDLAPSQEDLPEGAVGWVAYIEVIEEAGRFNKDGTYTPAKKRFKKVREIRYDAKGDD